MAPPSSAPRAVLTAALASLAAILAGSGCGGNDSGPHLIYSRPPGCAMTVPAGESVVDQTQPVPVEFTVEDPDSDNLTLVPQWSSDQGASFSLCTPTEGTNPFNVAPGAITFTWDAAADLAPSLLPIAVRIGIAIDDNESSVGRCFTPFGPGGSGDFILASPTEQPTCRVLAPEAGACVQVVAADDGVEVQVLLADAQGDPISLTACFSLDGGATYAPATLVSTTSGTLGAFAAAHPDACANAGAGQLTGAASGPVTLVWNAGADGVGATGCQDVGLRLSPEDGTPANDFSTCELAFAVDDLLAATLAEEPAAALLVEVFASDDPGLVRGDRNEVTDVFARLEGGEIRRVSLAPDGSEGNGPSFSPSVSADGRFVVFASRATNLVRGDTNACCDVFVRDLRSGEQARVSQQADGTQARGDSFSPRISASGREIRFTTRATSLSPRGDRGEVRVPNPLLR